MSGSSNTMGGLNSPNYKEYEMLKARQKAEDAKLLENATEEQKKAIEQGLRKDKKEWIGVFAAVVVIAVVVAIIMWASGAH